MCLELLVPAFLPIIYVRYIQPQEESLYYMICYNISILYIVLYMQISSILFAFFLAIYLVNSYRKLEDDQFLGKWGALYKEFNTKSKYDFLYILYSKIYDCI